MSDYLPLELQLNIMKRLPVKSLIQCRTLSKTWKSLIDSAEFINHYSAQSTQLLVSYFDCEQKYVSIADDQTFPQNKVSLTIPLLLQDPRIIGISHGLLCLFGEYEVDCVDATYETETVVLWNLSIRKAVAVVVPYWVSGSDIGFGVCRQTNDPKIVKITHDNGWEVQVFTLSTGAWRSCNNLPRDSIRISESQQFVDGFFHWLATDEMTMDGGSRSCNLILSLDITSEEFTEVNLPYSLADAPYDELSMSKLRGSLVVLEHGAEANNTACGVWLMEDGDPKAFTKLFSISVNTSLDAIFIARGFGKTGEAIIEIVEDGRGQLFSYESCSKHISSIGIGGGKFSFDVHSYMETLLLLDQPNLTVYNKI